MNDAATTEPRSELYLEIAYLEQRIRELEGRRRYVTTPARMRELKAGLAVLKAKLENLRRSQAAK